MKKINDEEFLEYLKSLPEEGVNAVNDAEMNHVSSFVKSKFKFNFAICSKHRCYLADALPQSIFELDVTDFVEVELTPNISRFIERSDEDTNYKSEDSSSSTVYLSNKEAIKLFERITTPPAIVRTYNEVNRNDADLFTEEEWLKSKYPDLYKQYVEKTSSNHSRFYNDWE